MTVTLPNARGAAAYQRWRLLRDPIGFVESCARDHGDAFRLALGPMGTHVFSRPDHVRAIYAADPDVLRAGEAKRAIFGPVLGRSSSLLLDGEPHARRRKLLLPRFRGDALGAYRERIVAATKRTVERLPEHRELALLEPLAELTLRIMTSALFGAPSPRNEALHLSLERFTRIAASSRLLMAPALQWDLGAWSPWGRVRRTVRDTVAVVDAEIARRGAPSGEPADLLDLLLAATDESGQALTAQEVRDEVLTLAVAGHEITSMVLAWLVHAVVTRRDVSGRIEDERVSAGPDDARPYLGAVIRESMRFHSVVPFGSARVASAPIVIGAHEVPRGGIVQVALHLLHRRPEVFEDPDEFRPERFTGEVRPRANEWAPFGGGARRCLGMSFALLELELITSAFLEALAVTPVGPPPRPVRRGAFVAPEAGLRVVVRRRAPSRASVMRAKLAPKDVDAVACAAQRRLVDGA